MQQNNDDWYSIENIRLVNKENWVAITIEEFNLIQNTVNYGGFMGNTLDSHLSVVRNLRGDGTSIIGDVDYFGVRGIIFNEFGFAIDFNYYRVQIYNIKRIYQRVEILNEKITITLTESNYPFRQQIITSENLGEITRFYDANGILQSISTNSMQIYLFV
ncbi:MAG: hypothetical protein FWE22_06565 [Firmicutes bacterium]|nr:hypothetical protein [Bacillota bacterium]